MSLDVILREHGIEPLEMAHEIKCNPNSQSAACPACEKAEHCPTTFVNKCSKLHKGKTGKYDCIDCADLKACRNAYDMLC